jgi:hypothetical protein
VLREIEATIRAFYLGISGMTLGRRLVLAAWLGVFITLTYIKPGPDAFNQILLAIGFWTTSIGSVVAGALVGSLIFVRR